MMPLLQVADDLHHIGLGSGAHPRGFGAVIRGHDDHSKPGRDVADALTFSAGIADELPAVRPVPVEGDEHVARFGADGGNAECEAGFSAHVAAIRP